MNATNVQAIDKLWAAAHKAIRSWWRNSTAEMEVLATLNEYQASLCKLLGITVQLVTSLEGDLAYLSTKEAVLGGDAGILVGISYCYTANPRYMLTMREGRTNLTLEAYSTQELVDLIHKGYAIIRDIGPAPQ